MLVLSLVSLTAMAVGPQFLTYEGYIQDKVAPFNPVTTPQNFKVQIKSPTNGSSSTPCVLYEENHNLAPVTNGAFALQVGTGVVNVGYTTTDLAALFSNLAPITTSGCTYNPASGDQRSLFVQIFDTGSYQPIADIKLGAAPFAFNSDRVGGSLASEFLKISNGSQSTPLTSAQVAELVNLIAGTSSSYLTPSSAPTFTGTVSFSNAPQFSGTPSGASDITNKTYVDSAISTAVAGSLPNVGTAGTYYQVTTDAKGRVTSGTNSLVAADIPSLDAAKISTGTFGGAVGINTTGNIYSSGTVTGLNVAATNLKIYNGANYLQISASSMSGTLNWILPNSNGTAGQVLRTDGAGNLSWVAAPAGTVTGVTATSPLASSGGANPDISMPQSSVTASGFLSSTDFNTFNNKLGTATTFAGDVSGVYNNTIVDKLKGAALSITSLASGNFLKYDGSNWINASLSGGDITAGLSYTPLNKAGDSMTGLLYLSSDPSGNLGAATKQFVNAAITTDAANYIRKDGTVPFTGDQSMGSRRLTSVAEPTSAQDAATKNYADTKILGKVATAPTGAEDGQSLRWNQTTLTWDYYTPVAGTGLSSLNGATGPSQTFANGSSGTAPIFTTSTTIHTLNIPMANTASVTAGLISKTEYDAFNLKLGSASTFVGDVSGTYNTTSVDKLKGVGLSITSLASGNFLRYTGSNWINANLSNADITTGLSYAPVNKAGDTITGKLVLNQDPTATLEAANKQYVDAAVTTGAANFIRKDGSVAFMNSQSMGSNKLVFVTDPTSAQDAATKNYADTKIVGKVATAPTGTENGQSLKWNQAALTWDYFAAEKALGFMPVNRAGDTMSGSLISAAGTAAAPAFGVGATTLGLFNGGPDILGFSTAGTERMRIDAAGNVGIGTTSPTGRLEVVQTGGDPLRGIVSTQISNTGAARLTFKRARGTPVSLASVQTGDSLGSLAAYGYGSASYAAGSSAAINFEATQDFATDVRGGKIVFYTKANGAMDSTDAAGRMRIDQNGDVSIFEKVGVGIGTTTPTASLELKAGAAAANSAPLKFRTGVNLTSPEAGAVEYDGMNLYFTDSTSVRRTIASGSYLPLAGGSMTGQMVSATGTAAAPSVGVGSTSIGLFSGGTDILGFSTGGLERMRITNTGNVGISSNSPGYPLEVGTSANTGSVASFTSGSSSSATARFANTTGETAAFFVGKVGISSNSPGAALQVTGQIVSPTVVVATGGIINFSQGNNQLLQSVGSNNLTLNGMQNGGSYTILLTDLNPRTYNFSGCTTLKMKPANGPTTGGLETIYSISYFNNVCYISWSSGW